MVMFQQGSYDKAASPTGVHHKITGDAFSVRWTVEVEPQYTAAYTFRVQGGAGFRLWVDGRAIIDSWAERSDNTDVVDSIPIMLAEGLRYKIRLETFNTSGARGCQFLWTCGPLQRMVHVPQSQLYP